jgi:uncharacterized membrane protein
MNITRAGFVLLIVGLILLMNASSSHVPRHVRVSYGELDEGESQKYVILIAPVGPANMCIGLQPESSSDLPPGFFQYDLTDVPVHMIFTDPDNNIIAEEDVITPYCFDATFNERGAYNVHVTNNGNATTTMPIDIFFDFHNPDNKEADKYVLSLILIVLGGVVVVVGFVMNFFEKQKTAKQYSKRLSTVKP